MRGALRKDAQISSLMMAHAMNRDRVITTSSSLSVYANALNRCGAVVHTC